MATESPRIGYVEYPTRVVILQGESDLYGPVYGSVSLSHIQLELLSFKESLMNPTNLTSDSVLEPVTVRIGS